MGEHINSEHQTEAHDAVEFIERELLLLGFGTHFVKNALSFTESVDINDGNDGNLGADA